MSSKFSSSLFGDITTASARSVIAEISDPKVHSGDLWVCSIGGELEAALALYDAIKRLGNITVIATGICASAANIVLQAAARRVATPTTQFIVHDGHDTSGNPKSPALYAPHLNGIVAGLVMDRAIYYKDQNVYQKGIFTAEEALQFKFIDEIYRGSNAD